MDGLLGGGGGGGQRLCCRPQKLLGGGGGGGLPPLAPIFLRLWCKNRDPYKVAVIMF